MAAKIKECEELTAAYELQEWENLASGLYEILHIGTERSFIYNKERGGFCDTTFDVAIISHERTRELDKLACSKSLMDVLNGKYDGKPILPELLNYKCFALVHWNRQLGTHKFVALDDVDVLSDRTARNRRFTDF